MEILGCLAFICERRLSLLESQHWHAFWHSLHHLLPITLALISRFLTNQKSLASPKLEAMRQSLNTSSKVLCVTVLLIAAIVIPDRTVAGFDELPKTLFQWSNAEVQQESEEEESDRLVTVRPHFSEASSLVGLGRIQLETGYSYFRDNDGGTFQTHSFPSRSYERESLPNGLNFDWDTTTSSNVLMWEGFQAVQVVAMTFMWAPNWR